jgi:hypothetical protein
MTARNLNTPGAPTHTPHFQPALIAVNFHIYMLLGMSIIHCESMKSKSGLVSEIDWTAPPPGFDIIYLYFIFNVLFL